MLARLTDCGPMGYFPPTLVLFAFGVYLMAAMLFHLNFQPLIRRYPNPKANTGVSETTCPLLSSQRDHLIRFRNHTFPISQPEDFRMDGTVGVYITSSFVSLSSGVPVVSFAVFRASTWSEATSICTGCSGVSQVDADVAAKKVTVTSDGATTKQAMLDALLKWSTASGKTVELATD